MNRPNGATSDGQKVLAIPANRTITEVYYEEEGMEGLVQHYINVHGLCRLPRARCDTCSERSGPLNEPVVDKHPHLCQKGQYMLVRIPPHCKVKWKNRHKFGDEFTKYHSTYTWTERFSKRFMKTFNKVGVSRIYIHCGFTELSIALRCQQGERRSDRKLQFKR